MNRKDLLVKIAAIISVLAEVDGSPESTLYLACGSDMALWEVIRSILVESGQVKISNHYARLTEVGKETAARLNHSLA